MRVRVRVRLRVRDMVRVRVGERTTTQPHNPATWWALAAIRARAARTATLAMSPGAFFMVTRHRRCVVPRAVLDIEAITQTEFLPFQTL